MNRTIGRLGNQRYFKKSINASLSQFKILLKFNKKIQLLTLTIEVGSFIENYFIENVS